MSLRIHGQPDPERPSINPLTDRALWMACRAGTLPAELLNGTDRTDLVYEFVSVLGWTDVEIAVHTKWSTYTVERLRHRLGLRPNKPKGAVA